jgi:hypothetical protein
MKLRLSPLTAYLLEIGLIFSLFVGGAALNDAGLNYSTKMPGGVKIHPYTYFTVIAALLCGGGMILKKKYVPDYRIAMAGALVIVAMIAVKGLTGDGQSLGFALDTIADAFLLIAVLHFVSRSSERRFSRILLVFFMAECTIALIEAVTHINFIPVDTWYGGSFRSTALQGHPLNNALILVTVATALQANSRRLESALIFIVAVFALTAFGARGALVVYIIANTIRFFRYGLVSAPRASVLIVGGVAGAVGLAWLITSGVLSDRISRVGAYDDSSQTRFQALLILRSLNWAQIFWGSDAGAISRLMDAADVGVVENYLVGYILMFGLVITGIIFLLFARSAKFLFQGITPIGRREMIYLATAFFFAALTNNSLITKTPALYIFVICLWCVRCRHLARESLSDNAVHKLDIG